jgi:hypothetical protein
VQTGSGAHPASCIMGTGSFPAVKRLGRGPKPPYPLLAQSLTKGWSYTSTLSWALGLYRDPFISFYSQIPSADILPLKRDIEFYVLITGRTELWFSTF